MQLTEDEIVNLICLYWDTAKWTNWMELAAHAIAEKLKEGVVWEGIGRFDPFYENESCFYLHDEEHDLMLSIDVCGNLGRSFSNQLMTVTVSKKEEGDGQG